MDYLFIDLHPSVHRWRGQPAGPAGRARRDHHHRQPHHGRERDPRDGTIQGKIGISALF